MSGFSHVLEALFGGLTGGEPWDGFLRELRDALTAEFATLILTPPGASLPGQILTPDAPSEQVERYVADFFASDPFTGLPEGKVTTFHDFVGARVVADEAFRSWLEKYSSHVLGVDIRAPSGFEARLRLTRAAGPPFRAGDVEGLAQYVPHVRIALDLYHALQADRSEHAVYSGAIEHLSVGVVVLDHEGLIVRSNAVADDILARGDGLARSGQGLRFADARHRARIQTMLADPASPPADGAPGILRVERPSGAGDYGVAIHRIATPGFMRTGRSPALALLISDPERAAATNTEALRTRFGLTRKEALLAGEIAAGRSLDEAAGRLGIARNTARTHLRGLFAKTGVSRQGELVRLVHTSLPGMGGGEG